MANMAEQLRRTSEQALKTIIITILKQYFPEEFGNATMETEP